MGLKIKLGLVAMKYLAIIVALTSTVITVTSFINSFWSYEDYSKIKQLGYGKYGTDYSEEMARELEKEIADGKGSAMASQEFKNKLKELEGMINKGEGEIKVKNMKGESVTLDSSHFINKNKKASTNVNTTLGKGKSSCAWGASQIYIWASGDTSFEGKSACKSFTLNDGANVTDNPYKVGTSDIGKCIVFNVKDAGVPINNGELTPKKINNYLNSKNQGVNKDNGLPWITEGAFVTAKGGGQSHTMIISSLDGEGTIISVNDYESLNDIPGIILRNSANYTPNTTVTITHAPNLKTVAYTETPGGSKLSGTLYDALKAKKFRYPIGTVVDGDLAKVESVTFGGYLKITDTGYDVVVDGKIKTDEFARNNLFKKYNPYSPKFKMWWDQDVKSTEIVSILDMKDFLLKLFPGGIEKVVGLYDPIKRVKPVSKNELDNLKTEDVTMPCTYMGTLNSDYANFLTNKNSKLNVRGVEYSAVHKGSYTYFESSSGDVLWPVAAPNFINHLSEKKIPVLQYYDKNNNPTVKGFCLDAKAIEQNPLGVHFTGGLPCIFEAVIGFKTKPSGNPHVDKNVPEEIRNKLKTSTRIQYTGIDITTLK